MRPAPALIAVAAAGLVASGCGTGGQAASVPSGSVRAGAPRSAAGSSRGGVVAASVIPEIVNQPAARRDVALTRCSGDASGWSAAGTVSNGARADAAYTIVISFTDLHSTVLARETARVDVPAGGSEDWKVDARFTAPRGVVCVLRGVQRV